MAWSLPGSSRETGRFQGSVLEPHTCSFHICSCSVPSIHCSSVCKRNYEWQPEQGSARGWLLNWHTCLIKSSCKGIRGFKEVGDIRPSLQAVDCLWKETGLINNGCLQKGRVQTVGDLLNFHCMPFLDFCFVFPCTSITLSKFIELHMYIKETCIHLYL